MNVPVPTVEMPERLRAAAEALAEREAELRVAEAAVQAGEEAVRDGRRRDLELVAESREAGERDDPQAEHEQQAMEALAVLEREREIMAARVRKLAAEHDRLAEELLPRWREAIEKAWRRLDTQQRRRVSELAAGTERAKSLQIAWRYVATLADHPQAAERELRKAGAIVNATALDLGEVRRAIEDMSADRVTEQVARARADQLERDEAATRATEEVVEQARQAREAEIARDLARREALAE